MDAAALTAAGEAWVAADPCAETREAVRGLLDAKDEDGLRAAFQGRVEFGTAGLRAEMGPGTTRLNDLVIIQTAQGLAKYLETTLGEEEARKRGIVLGFDHRERGALNSRRFALLTAAVFLSRNFKVYLFGEFVATPFVPFAIKKFSAAAGVMVTASHNPKNDNGFKVYWGNACQIIPPHDEGIAATIDAELKPWEANGYDHVTDEFVRGNELCSDPLDEVAAAYFETIAGMMCRHKDENSQNPVKFAYTAMHGIGHRWAKRAFEAFGHNAFAPVEAQVQPDPTFPTVAFPNPEEGKGALQLSFETAAANDCTVVLANDPDADRLAVAELAEDGSWKIFTGNETAALLGHWEWVNYKKSKAAKGDGEPATKVQATSKGAAVVASTVSSKMLRAMGEKEGFHFEECLTGFKWIGNKSMELREQGYDVIFGFEEAIGFCIGDNVPDKDGVSAMAVFAEMANQLKKEGKTCAQHLRELQEKYGFFVTNNHYVVSHDTELNKTVFEALRANGEYLKDAGDGAYKIKYVRDLLSPGFDSSREDTKPTLPVSASSQMITFTFENGAVATLRMSGTEPKLKYYTEMSGPDPEKTAAELAELVEKAIKGDMLKELTAAK